MGRGSGRGGGRTEAFPPRSVIVADDPLWYKDAVIYQLHVKAFYDRNDDGIGDFRGLTEKLDYLQDLGVNAIWLLPFYPSPLRDDGYDIADYTATSIRATARSTTSRPSCARPTGAGCASSPSWSSITPPTSIPGFRRRARRPGSPWRDFYVWSDTPEKYKDARIIFKDFETSNWTWDPVAKAYYWHRFFSHQPDLNFDNPAVHEALFKVLDFWMDLGVDAFRLDAIPYLFEREGTTARTCRRRTSSSRSCARSSTPYPNRMLLAEANQWPEDSAPYFGDGDECHMAFHFPLMPRMFMALRHGGPFPDRRHHGPDAGHPRQLPVGAVSSATTTS